MNDRWLAGVMAVFDRETRPIKLAWALEGPLFRYGCTFVGDKWLSVRTAVPVEKVDVGLRLLEDKGAIIRAHIRQPDGTLLRHIFPAH